ncbi:Hypothetical predicted protein [Olea europaea subsp. europaea]|uniref:Uncharacterized protein n=1 Tax=Olea europaea subsp. europaea TaxID=158383 RepID=A0A8S0ULR2_OLEEU|nr:Hypothetical predicted protein [Olea europaea subsp. europaea]
MMRATEITSQSASNSAVDASGSFDSMAFYEKSSIGRSINRSQKKDKSTCTFGFPAGYKPKRVGGVNNQEDPSNQANRAVAGLVSEPVHMTDHSRKLICKRLEVGAANGESTAILFVLCVAKNKWEIGDVILRNIKMESRRQYSSRFLVSFPEKRNGISGF